MDSSEENGRFGRLINHSCKIFNLKPKVFAVGDCPRVVFVATRDVAADEELLFDYGERRGFALNSETWCQC
jgi:histone-lysine N-methyltransferase SETD8